jgi:NAD(P)-dependent dehydrogenase (short-subunit alcohol dehydrogenase family)
MQLAGRVALVTGGAHRVGRGIALALARSGVQTAIHYGSSEMQARQTVQELAALGVAAFAMQADLADPAQIERLIRAVEEQFNRLDILVNSAASFTRQPFDAITAADWDHALAVNLRAPFLLSQQAAPLMRRSGRDAPGLIVNIADLSGVYSWQGYVQHGVSKAGLLHLTRITARELAPDIRANALVLGPVLPPPGMAEDDPRWSEIRQSVPLKRSAAPDEVGQAVAALAENDFITGAELAVDGGERLLGAANH